VAAAVVLVLVLVVE